MSWVTTETGDDMAGRQRIGHRGWPGAAFCMVLWLGVCVATPAGAQEDLEAESNRLRTYDVPAQFRIPERIVESTDTGETLIANTTGEGADATCLVIIASGDSARAYPYRHGAEGTRCVDAVVHPDGGFVVRGQRAGAESGAVSGFVARIDAQGREQWLVHDTRTAESDAFEASYKAPTGPLAYSRESGQLLTFTLGEISPGNGESREITHASVLSEGEMTVPAKRLGAGFGRIGNVAAFEASGEFLVHLFRPGSPGAEFVTYDGRQTIDAYRPLEESWDQRVVRRMSVGPGGRVYLLWTEETAAEGPTHVSVAGRAGDEVWSATYESAIARPDAAPGADTGSTSGELELGPPKGMWVGADYIVVLYEAGDSYLRVLETSSGEELGTVTVSSLTDLTLLNVLRGGEGELKLLAVDQQQGRFHELGLTFEADSSGSGDAGFVDGGADAGAGGNNGGGGGCSSTGDPLPVSPLFFVFAAAVCSVLRRCHSGRIQIH